MRSRLLIPSLALAAVVVGGCGPGEVLKGVVLPVLAVGLMLLVIIARFFRDPARPFDPPGFRTYLTFAGADALATDAERAEGGEGGGPLAGEGIALCLREALVGAGIATGPAILEDYGHSLDAEVEEEPVVLHLGHLGDGDRQWLLCIDYPRSRFELLLRRPASPPWPGPGLGQLLGALDTQVRALPGVRAVLWHRRERWDDGDFDDAAAAPLAGPEDPR